MNKKDRAWCRENGVWLDETEERYDGYWYIGGFEYQYQYVPDCSEYGGWKLAKITTSPLLIAKYRSKSLPALIKKIRELNAKNKRGQEDDSGVDWGYMTEEDAKDSDYFPKEFIEIIAEEI